MSRFEQPTFLVHSAKGTSWEKKDHKYTKKIQGKDGKWYYVYGEAPSPTEEADNEETNYVLNNGKVATRKEAIDREVRLYNLSNKNIGDSMAEYHAKEAMKQAKNRRKSIERKL